MKSKKNNSKTVIVEELIWYSTRDTKPVPNKKYLVTRSTQAVETAYFDESIKAWRGTDQYQFPDKVVAFCEIPRGAKFKK